MADSTRDNQIGNQDRELWFIERVAGYLDIGIGAARGQLSRWGVKAVDYQMHPTWKRTAARFDAEEVRAARSNRAGRGARTDLTHTYDWEVRVMGTTVAVGEVRARGDEQAVELALNVSDCQQGGEDDLVVRRRGRNTGAGNWIQYDAEVVRVTF